MCAVWKMWNTNITFHISPQKGIKGHQHQLQYVKVGDTRLAVWKM